MSIKHIDEIHTPAVLIETRALDRNIEAMQAVCNANGVELWPHCKTHKLVPVLRKQLQGGAVGATCAKIGEAEALLPSGVRRVFIAHALPMGLIGPRLKKLAASLDELLLAVTSAAYFGKLEELLKLEGLRLPVLMAVDTGLDREGVRTEAEAQQLAARIRQSPQMEFRGIYTHEGQTYKSTPEEVDAAAGDVLRRMKGYAEAIGGEVLLWPGCSVTAAKLAEKGGVHAVRPGAYLFGDLSLTRGVGVMKMEDVAVTLLVSVLDRPTATLALIDAGSKTFSSDKSSAGFHAEVLGHRGMYVTRVNEEHGYIPNADERIRIGDRLRCVPAHICTVMNLASHVYLVDGEKVLDTWTVNARGKVS